MAADQFLRLPDVETIVGLRKTKIYALMKAREFPRPTKIGAASRWSRGVIDEWMKAKLAA